MPNLSRLPEREVRPPCEVGIICIYLRRVVYWPARLRRISPELRLHIMSTCKTGTDQSLMSAPRRLRHHNIVHCHRRRKFPRRTSVQSAIASCRVETCQTLRPCARHTSISALRRTARITEARRASRLQTATSLPRLWQPGELACFLTWRPKRTASILPNAPSALKSSRLACRWHDWSACAGSTGFAFLLGLSTIPDGAPSTSMTALGISEWDVWKALHYGVWRELSLHLLGQRLCFVVSLPIMVFRHEFVLQFLLQFSGVIYTLGTSLNHHDLITLSV
jgi:hypothetical protein